MMTDGEKHPLVMDLTVRGGETPLFPKVEGQGMPEDIMPALVDSNSCG